MATESRPGGLSRRRLLRLAACAPLGALLAACGGSRAVPRAGDAAESEPPPTSTPEPPFVVAAGEQQRLLMEASPYETPLYVFGSGLPGPVLAVLGGVHGNEPGGWMAAERVQKELRPAAGALIVLPRANRLAIRDFVRTTDELGDLNRLYPGSPDGQPMARMAFEIVRVFRELRASVVLDLHESWAFYRDRTETQTGTAYLGQTVSSSTPEGMALARDVVDAVNQRVQAPREELFLREWPPRGFGLGASVPGATPAAEAGTMGRGAAFGGSRSSLGLSAYVPGLTPILVEMGQQQPIERRAALHVEIVNEVARRIGLV